MKACAIAIAALLLSACGPQRPCLKSHKEPHVQYVQFMTGIINGVPQYIMMPIFQEIDVCDQYGDTPST